MFQLGGHLGGQNLVKKDGYEGGYGRFLARKDAIKRFNLTDMAGKMHEK